MDVCNFSLLFPSAELICCHESTGHHDITEKERSRGPEQRRHVYCPKRNQCINVKILIHVVIFVVVKMYCLFRNAIIQ